MPNQPPSQPPSQQPDFEVAHAAMRRMALAFNDAAEQLATLASDALLALGKSMADLIEATQQKSTGEDDESTG